MSALAMVITFMLGSGTTYVNPVLVDASSQLADPTVILHEGTYYLYPTGDRSSYDVYTSANLVDWTKGPKVFKPGASNVFAPDVFRDPADGLFYLYYSADFHVGVAVAGSPLGPFDDQGVLVDNALDAHMVYSGGTYYLYYAKLRADGADIFVQPMLDPVTPDGEPVFLLQPDQPWEFSELGVSIVEAPWIVVIGETWYLMYSGNYTRRRDYDIGYATSDSPTGPFLKHAGNPITVGPPFVWGAGHHAVVSGPDGQPWVVYHQKMAPFPGRKRAVCIDRLLIDSQGVLRIGTTKGMPRPAP